MNQPLRQRRQLLQRLVRHRRQHGGVINGSHRDRNGHHRRSQAPVAHGEEEGIRPEESGCRHIDHIAAGRLRNAVPRAADEDEGKRVAVRISSGEMNRQRRVFRRRHRLRQGHRRLVHRRRRPQLEATEPVDQRPSKSVGAATVRRHVADTPRTRFRCSACAYVAACVTSHTRTWKVTTWPGLRLGNTIASDCQVPGWLVVATRNLLSVPGDAKSVPSPAPAAPKYGCAT